MDPNVPTPPSTPPPATPNPPVSPVPSAQNQQDQGPQLNPIESYLLKNPKYLIIAIGAIIILILTVIVVPSFFNKSNNQAKQKITLSPSPKAGTPTVQPTGTSQLKASLTTERLQQFGEKLTSKSEKDIAEVLFIRNGEIDPEMMKVLLEFEAVQFDEFTIQEVAGGGLTIEALVMTTSNKVPAPWMFVLVDVNGEWKIGSIGKLEIFTPE